MRQEHLQQFARYGVAVLATVCAVVVTEIIRPFVYPSVTPPFILAVAVAALYGGRGPGALACLLSLAALSYWFLPPLHVDTPVDLSRQALFLVVAGLTALIAGIAYEQRSRALLHAKENERLRTLAEEAASEAEMATQQATEASQEAEAEATKARDAALEAELAAQEAAEALSRQQEAEVALRQRDAELVDFFETASVGLHWMGPDGTIIMVNQAELDMLGYKRDEFLGRHVGQFHVDQPVMEDILQRLISGETLSQYPARLRCKDGTVKDVLIDSSSYFKDGRFAHTRCFTRDVTAEKQAQEAVARLAAIVSSSSDAIISKTLDGIVTSWNSAAEHIFGYSAAEMVGQPIYRLIPPNLHDAERDLLERVQRGEVVEFSESERIRKDGTRVWISLSVSPVRDSSGQIIGAASIKRDITQRRVIEERLRDTQRLQAVGQLAGGIAHEANNQMSVVLGGVHFLLRRTDLPEAAREDLDQMRQAAERTASITQQLLAFSRRQRLELQDVNLNTVVQSISSILRRSLTETQRLQIRLGVLNGLIRADQRQLEQVLLNLTLNARDAMVDGGTLIVETTEVELVSRETGAGGPSPGTYQVLTVADTGHGMDRTTLDHAFEPFFTTKDVGQGTGLGLSVVHGIVSQVGGHINIETAPGQGTTFKLYFPVVSPQGGHEPLEVNRPPTLARGTVALVVEDDPLVRSMAARALAEVGCQVIQAGDGRSALDLVREYTGRLDVVVTDVGMPEMDGYELAQCLHEERPALPVVFMTGYADEPAGTGVVLARTVLQKPFSPDALVRAVGEVLRSRGGSGQ